ncbi:unnamed protein product [Brachionus calyciflorus]|uniref:Uncharacterized protein n=1 Tax=Brachionus calyciflorus TaxID=104777 RepID=A0A814KEX9_9BILA|nr:unnamed protein product [Brachionus calyciflorus]
MNYDRHLILTNVKSTVKYKSAVVGEYISSQHDVYSISRFLSCFKDDYERCYQQDQLKFRLICLDYSWASIHAVLKALNNENVIEYSNRVFKLSNDGIIESDKSWLCSCVANTMKRFSHSIKNFNKNSVFHKYVCYVFSLLVNSSDLKTITAYLKMLGIILLSPKRPSLSKETIEQLDNALKDRPKG